MKDCCWYGGPCACEEHRRAEERVEWELAAQEAAADEQARRGDWDWFVGPDLPITEVPL